MAANDVFEIGDGIRLQGSFSELITNSPVDPSTISFITKDPAGTVTTFVMSVDAGVIRQDVGVYYFDWVVNTMGDHNWRMTGVGTGQTAKQDFFTVRSLNV